MALGIHSLYACPKRYAICLGIYSSHRRAGPMDKEKRAKARPAVVLLKDLAPRKTVKGGTGKVLFGQSVPPAEAAGGAKGAKKGAK
jgi:hypothetical protein